MSRLYNHIVYAGIWWFVSRLLIQPYCIRGNLAIWLYAAHTTTVYVGIWCSICKPAYTTALYKRAYVSNFESGYVFYSKSSYVFWHGWVGFVSPRIQRDCISGYVLDFDLICFISEISYVFFRKMICFSWKICARNGKWTGPRIQS